MLNPTIGAWYQDITDMQLFEVVAVDDSSGSIDVQYVDGELTEFDFDTWQELTLIPAEPPEDPDAPFEQTFEAGDHWNDEVLHPGDWSSPINSIEADLFTGFDDL